MTNEEAIKNLKEHKSVYTNCAADAEANETIEMAIKALEQEPCADIAQERYKDLCEYFGGAKDILKSRKDFKAWLGRVKWHIRKAEELYEKYEYKQEPILDKIRGEIEQEYNHLSARRDETLELGECLGLKMSLKIIDKYKTENKIEQALTYADQDTLMSAT